MPGRSTIEAIYLLRRVMEQYRMVQQDLHLIFIDLEKAYDRVPREGLGLHIFELSKICMIGYRLVLGHRVESQTIFPSQLVCIKGQPLAPTFLP